MQDGIKVETSIRSAGMKSAGAAARAPWLAYGLAAGAVLALAYATRDGALSDWDSWEYASLAVRMKVSGLCLGRWWFIVLMHGAYRLGELMASVGLLHAYEPMRAAVAAMTAGAVAALMHWTFLFTGRRGAAIAAGAMAVMSAPLLFYSAAVMTEGPTLLLGTLAFLMWQKAVDSPAGGGPRVAWAVAAGLAFGMMADMREPAVLLAAWPAASCLVYRRGGRWALLAAAGAGAAAALGVGVAMASRQWGSPPWEFIRGYSTYMAGERATYGWHGGDNALYLLEHWTFVAPLAVLGALMFAAAWPFVRGSGGRMLAAGRGRAVVTLLAAGAPYLAMTWYNPDLWCNYRLMLPLAWLAIPACAELAVASVRCWGALPQAGQLTRAGRGLQAGLAVGGAAMAALLCAIAITEHARFTADQARIYAGLCQLGDGVSVVAGPGAPMGYFLRDLGAAPGMEIINPGFDATPENMAARMEERLAKGRRVFVNTSPVNWYHFGQVNVEYEAAQEATWRFDRRSAAWPFVEVRPKTVGNKGSRS